MYRAIRREHLRNRREHSVEHIRTKLVILDFVLAYLDYRYLETETEKVEYFCKELGISKEALPAKRYAGAIREKTTDRYFVDKFPMFFVPDSSSFSPVVSIAKTPYSSATPLGGRTAAILASLTSSCHRHEMDPHLYFMQLLVNLPSWPASHLDAWLPDHWKQAHIARCAALGIPVPPTP